MNRRRMLTLLAGVPVVGPLASKMVQDEKMAALISPREAQGLLQGVQPTMPGNVEAEPERFKWAMNFPWFKAAQESLLYEENKHVWALDPDLAAMKSFSMNAKICFQRQRNVQKALDYKMGESVYHKMSNLWKRLPSFLLPK